MAGQTVRMGSAIAITPTTLLVIEKNELLRVRHAEHELSYYFISYMLAHNIRVEEELIDQLFNSTESAWRARFCFSRAMENKSIRKAGFRKFPRRRWRR
jgi:hypothetical protein